MTVTTQRTGKAWKLLMLASIATIAWGMVIAVPAFQEASRERVGAPAYQEAISAATKGVAITIGGLVLAVVARLGAWWFHG